MCGFAVQRAEDGLALRRHLEAASTEQLRQLGRCLHDGHPIDTSRLFAIVVDWGVHNEEVA
jgi:hypothetical protein